MGGRMIGRLAAACAATLLLAAAPAPDDPAAKFGVRESVENISLSPDGSRIAYIAPNAGQGSTLYTVDLPAGTSRPAITVDGNTQRILNCNWVSNTRLACQIFGTTSYQTRLLQLTRYVAVDADGKNVKLLSERENRFQTRLSNYGGGVVDWLPEETDAVLMGRDFVPEAREQTRIEQKLDGYGVVRVDARTGRSTTVETPKLSAREFITDGHGRVRIMGLQPNVAGMMGDTINYFYRDKTSDAWKPFAIFNVRTYAGLNPYAIDRDLDAAYAMRKIDGRFALVRVALDGSLKEEPVVANPTVDIDDVVRLGRARRVIGASFVTDKRETIYFDPQMKALSAALSKSLPGLPLIRFAGASQDEQKLLIWAGSDADPGRYYIFDRKARKLDEIMLARPELEGTPLATVKAITYRAQDGTQIPAYLTLPPGSTGRNIPAIVMPHGGPSARDEWDFDWLSQYYAARGYAVLQPQYRGSSGYGDAWFQDQGFKNWAIAIGDVVDAGRWLVAQGIAAPDKLAIVGWSYGGYAALQANVVDPDLFKAAVAIAPVTDLALLAEQYRGWTDFALARDFIGTGPHLKQGSPAQNAERFKAPVLIFQGELDRNVEAVQARFMDSQLAKAGKKHELVLYPTLDHQLDDSAARTGMLRRSDAFLRSAMGL